MRAVGYTSDRADNGPQCLIDLDLPAPRPGPTDLLVRVSAVSVNPVDTKVRAGVAAPSSEPKVLGWDAVGLVEAVGAEVRGFDAGDRVWYAGDLTRPGTNAELHCVDFRIVGHAPARLTDAEAAAMPLTAITAWEMLFDRFRLPPSRAAGGKSALLVVGAAGGVGSIMVQLAAEVAGLHVVGTASRPESRAWVLSMGAGAVVDHGGDLAAQVAALGGPPVSHVACLTHSASHFPALAELIEPQGAIGLIDDPADPLDIRLLKRKSVSLHWEFMYTRSMFGTPDVAEQGRLLGEVAALVDAGSIRTTHGRTLGTINALNLRRAHESVQSGRTIGKIVLAGWPT